MNITHDIENPTVAIVHFLSEEARSQMPGGRVIHYQVTIKPENFTEGGFIRFGETKGDELMGWQLQSDIVIDEVLGELSSDETYVNNEQAA